MAGSKLLEIEMGGQSLRPCSEWLKTEAELDARESRGGGTDGR